MRTHLKKKGEVKLLGKTGKKRKKRKKKKKALVAAI